MSIAAVLGYLIVALVAIGLVGFARIRGIVSKTTDLVEKGLDATLEGADLVKEVNSKLISELRAGIKPTPKVTKKKTKTKVKPNPKP